jgi:hypothetical protein
MDDARRCIRLLTGTFPAYNFIRHMIGEFNIEHNSYLKAIRLYNTDNKECSFEIGRLVTSSQIPVQYFFAKTQIEAYQKVAHPAPRRQFVVTLKGKLQFKVSNGDQFIIEPGIILLAEDTEGEGHTWTLMEGDSWERLYIAYDGDAANHFIADGPMTGTF